MADQKTVKITVIKPFNFSAPLTGDNRLATITPFVPVKDKDGRYVATEFEITAEMADHPFFKDHHADGCIESDEQRAERLAAVKNAADKRKEDDARQTERAQEAMRRAQGGAQVKNATDAEVERDLNTPVNQLQKERGRDVTGAPPAKA